MSTNKFRLEYLTSSINQIATAVTNLLNKPDNNVDQPDQYNTQSSHSSSATVKHRPDWYQATHGNEN